MSDNTPRGVRDFSPAEAISLKRISGIAEEVFKRFGFYPLETPALENMSVLNSKAYGDEPSKEIFVMKDEETGLRYDFTVPLARYVAANKDLVLPFKRYQIGSAWRKDEPQKMRYREFAQADVDIVGSAETGSDAEVIAAAALVLEELGMRNYVILVNSRSLLKQVILGLGVPADKEVQAIRILDKLQKLKREESLAQLSALVPEGQVAEKLLGFVEQEGSNEEKLQRVSANVAESKDEVARMQELLKLLSAYKLNGKIVFDMALARGFDYYTGFVWEFAIEEEGKRLPSVGGGGRYDSLIGMYSKRNTPATGSSLGISRIFDVMGSSSASKTYAKVFVAVIGQQNSEYALNAATALRGNGIYLDMNPLGRNLSKQMEYASSLGIPWVIIVGDKEREANKLKLRNMGSGDEELITLQEAIEKLR
ncbi:MAG: histidine--tRNA ligase [Candidatus Micrarchaeota archaeon]|nr:histidine--tRNA ligase [Candidatus Micrarchaeota archaeon]